LSGLDVLKQIRANEKTCSVPVVILTSSVEENDREESINQGANSFFVKPIRFDEFTELIQQLSSDWLTSKECPSE
jgi:two-component system, response regulator